jgi:hypothetical protein
MDNIVPDTLVLKIEEYETNNLTDTILYVLYDTRSNEYIIRGKRRSSKTLISLPYSFTAETANGLADFIELIVCPENTVSYTLYNYDNLPNDSYDITYDFLEKHDDRSYEIVAYDNQRIKRADLLKCLKILRNVFNYY